jgi:hypothetical protein
MAQDAWKELEEITPLNRAKTEVLTVRLAVCRALKMWELAEEIARTLIRREPQSVMHVVALAEVRGKREGPVARQSPRQPQTHAALAQHPQGRKGRAAGLTL